MVSRLIKKIGAKIIYFIVPEIKVLKRDIDWGFIENNLYNNTIGVNVKIYPPAHINNCVIDNYTYIAHNSLISDTEIGKFCSIGPNFLCGRGIHPTKGISTSPMFYSTMKQNGMTLVSENKIEERKPISIGNDVFIGANVTILDGVSIGNGAIIGAGAVVSKDIPPYAIAVGTPIKIVKYRFEKDQIEHLLEINWWNLEIDKLKDIERLFFDVEKFIEKYSNQKQ
jgi:virginiamycin A acetyltransferase